MHFKHWDLILRCAHIEVPPHSTHCAFRLPCGTQRPLPSQSAQYRFSFPCLHMELPLQSVHRDFCLLCLHSCMTVKVCGLVVVVVVVKVRRAVEKTIEGRRFALPPVRFISFNKEQFQTLKRAGRS